MHLLPLYSRACEPILDRSQPAAFVITDTKVIGTNTTTIPSFNCYFQVNLYSGMVSSYAYSEEYLFSYVVADIFGFYACHPSSSVRAPKEIQSTEYNSFFIQY